MKTAKEWLNQVGEAAGLDMFVGDPAKPGSRTEEVVRAIQLDAYRAGMTRAAEKIPPRHSDWHTAEMLKQLRAEILDERDNLKELP